jgi:hypothetical protein
VSNKVEITYNGKTHTGFVKSVESLVDAGRNIIGKLVLNKIMGYEVELFDSESLAIIKLQVEHFSDIKTIL